MGHNSIDAYVGELCSDHSSVSRPQWKILLSDAYEKKCRVLTVMGRYSSAVHFGRLSVVLDPGKFVDF